MHEVPPLTVRVDVPRSGLENMRRDAELLAAVAAGAPGGIRLYGFSPPCLSIGRLQDAADVDAAACARDGVEVVRRPTGGVAVLHDEEVTYAVVCAADHPLLGGDVLTSCARIHAAVTRGLAALGVEVRAHGAAADERAAARERAAVADCFARPASHELLSLDGRKMQTVSKLSRASSWNRRIASASTAASCSSPPGRPGTCAGPHRRSGGAPGCASCSGGR